MAACVPGDIVRHGDADKVVVDVTDDGFAVLRDKADTDLEDPTVATTEELEVVGHLDNGTDGWVEHEHGLWEQS